MINRDVVVSRLSRLGTTMKALRKLVGESKPDFLGNSTVIAATKYYILEVIQICLDVGNHIISAERWKRPRDYSSVFRILAENGVYDASLGDRLTEMAKFRNRVVHLYDDFDDALLYSIVTRDLDDIDAFAARVQSYLKRS